MSVAGRLVVVAGATSASGLAAARELTRAGARVVAVGRSADKLDELREVILRPRSGSQDPPVTLREVAGPPIRTELCDLTNEAEVAELAQRIHDADGPVDGVLHLVGGWRGGGGLAGQTEADFRFLEQSFTALRHVTRAFDADLRASEAGRLAVVSSTAVARPLAGGANYAAVKAATEAWARAVAQGFAKEALRSASRPQGDGRVARPQGDGSSVVLRERSESQDQGDGELTAASVIFRVKSLAGLEDELARRFVDLWMAPAAQINDTMIELSARENTEIGQE